MKKQEMAVLLAKIQLGDNRHVDGLVLEYWLDTIGDLELPPALDALRRFRRERPGVYLEPGHLLELAGVVDENPSTIPDISEQILAESRARELAAAGVTEAEFAAHQHDPAWIHQHFAVMDAIDARPFAAAKEFDDE